MIITIVNPIIIDLHNPIHLVMMVCSMPILLYVTFVIVKAIGLGVFSSYFQAKEDDKNKQLLKKEKFYETK